MDDRMVFVVTNDAGKLIYVAANENDLILQSFILKQKMRSEKVSFAHVKEYWYYDDELLIPFWHHYGHF